MTRDTWYMAIFWDASFQSRSLFVPKSECIRAFAGWRTCLKCTSQDQEEQANPNRLLSSTPVTISRDSYTSYKRAKIVDTVGGRGHSSCSRSAHLQTKVWVESGLAQCRAYYSYFYRFKQVLSESLCKKCLPILYAAAKIPNPASHTRNILYQLQLSIFTAIWYSGTANVKTCPLKNFEWSSYVDW